MPVGSVRPSWPSVTPTAVCSRSYGPPSRSSDRRERLPVAEPLVTVGGLNCKGAHLRPECLVGVAAQDLPEGQMAVWVVDNASSDGSLELLADRFPWVRAIANGSNDGFARGNNVALREVTTPFVALINNDARPEPDWLRRLLEPFAEPGAERLGPPSAKIACPAPTGTGWGGCGSRSGSRGPSGWPPYRPRSCSCPGSWPSNWPPPGSCLARSTPGSWGCGSTGSRSTVRTSPSRCCGTGSPTVRRGRGRAASAGPARPGCCWPPSPGPPGSGGRCGWASGGRPRR